MGSSVSLRPYVRLGSRLSVFGVARLGSALSVKDNAVFGSCMSIRSFSRIGSALSIMDFVHFGSSVSLRSFVRLGSALSVLGKQVHLGDASTYFRYDNTNSQYEFKVDGGRSMTITNAGGQLHGTWQSDSAVTSSDRRLKTSIEPLYKAISKEVSKDISGSLAQAKAVTGAARPKAPSTAGTEHGDAVGWVLRELRPVSFKFKSGPEAKYARYGFVAQELQQVLPAVVRGTGEEHLKVAYQDLIALLTLAAQVLQDKVSDLQRTVTTQKSDFEKALDEQKQSTNALLAYVKKMDEKFEKAMAAKEEEVPPSTTQYVRRLEEKLERLERAGRTNRNKERGGEDPGWVLP
eukprot:CAMPEP_0195141748 /NCGR_PEP_ID=MMETSP0448-20130528/163487_1 /TAXON_ID=66468 /ORGANISM="Heterocapsa triquestra, Strain CCMP 448" /LENGTH=347 /DNA_ID=CAMNT_0040180137 /DNA_START=80 /DNA_END=1123 /DNA_ORIENTATION=+